MGIAESTSQCELGVLKDRLGKMKEQVGIEHPTNLMRESDEDEGHFGIH